MKRCIELFFVIIFLLTFVGCSIEKTTNHARFITEVVEVIDGDTIKIYYDQDNNGTKELTTVRILNIDTPEIGGNRGIQLFGLEAKEFAKKTLEGKTVEIEVSAKDEPFDQFNRLLAYVFIDDELYEELIVKEGLARIAYVFEPDTKYMKELEAAENYAKENQLGIWSIPGYVQKDGFNQEVVNSTSEGVNQDKCFIKGNIGKEKIYHTPDSPAYEQTKAEVMFCSVEEAIKAGFRAPKNQ